MSRLSKILKIQSGEGRTVALMTGIMLTVSIGGAVGTPGIDGLFFTRFGVAFLPYMYIGLGAVTIIMSLAVTFLLETTSRRRLYGALPLALALILLAARLLLSFDFLWFYPPLWLWISMMWSLQALFTWGLAGMATNTRQAKRLFPLFGAGGILGVSLGGLATQPLVSLLGAENLILIWSGSLAVAYGLARLLLAKLDGPELDARVRSTRRGRQVRLTANLTAGFEYVRKSPLLRWLSAGVVLFAVLFFSITFPFSKAATARFPDEDALSGFLGLFLGISTGIAFLISLFLANRLYARFGIMVMVLAYPVIYLAGFLLLFLFESFATLVVFRFVQILFYQGIAGSAYQAVYNAVPPDRRDQTRTFIDGVPGQIGVILAGVLLLLSERMLDARQLFLLAASLSALTAYATWRSGRAYRGALVEALRAGYPLLFDTEDEPFGGFQRDATAVAAVVEGIHHPDPVVRRVSAEILGSLSVPEATDALVNALDDEDAQVRAALLRSLAGSGAVSALLEVLLCLEDPSPEVREEAVKAVRTLSGYPRGVAVRIRPLLADPDPRVRAGTAVTLLSSGEDPEAEEVLAVMLAERDLDSRLAALNAVAGWGGAGAYDLVRNSLYDEHAVVRQAAVEALAATDPGRCLMPLVDATGDEDTDVQKAVAEALGAIGARALEPTLAALADPTREEGALLALEHIPLDGKAGTLHAYARDRIARALHYHRLSRQEALLVERDAEALLRDSLSRKALTLGTNALRALGLIRNRASIEMARKHLQSENADERANALEVLENIQDAALVRPLLGIWEHEKGDPNPPPDGWLEEALEDSDGWIRACAVLVAGHHLDPAIRGRLESMAASDADEDGREAARMVLKGAEPVETLQTLSVMERILFLRRVPLFLDLPPADLKRVASIARESLFSKGSVIASQGDQGEDMYIIVSGEVAVQVHDEQNRQEEVARRRAGEYVGEMAIISHEPRMATLVAVGEVRALCIGQQAFGRLLRERPQTSMAVMRVLCQRLREG